MTNLQIGDLQDFWIRVYLNPKNGLLTACADRAYRGLNRTLRGLGKEQSKAKYIRIQTSLIRFSQELVSKDFEDEKSFDRTHKDKCDNLIKVFNFEYKQISMTYGQAQKWINMYLKYLFALGDVRVPGIVKNYQFFHIPIDNIIQDELNKDKGLKRIPIAWSKLNNYQVYLDYQKLVREKYSPSIPMDIEFRLFNKSRPFL